MGKITQVNNGDTGLEARTKVNEAMKTVESDDTLTGTGTAADPLKVASPGGDVSQQEQTLAVVTNNIELDFNNKKQLLGVNLLAVSANATISRANTTNAQRDNFWLNISNLATITFPAGTYMQTFEKDAGRWDETTRVFTPASDGVYEFVETKVGANYYLKISDVNIGS